MDDDLKLTAILQEIERQGELAKILLESPLRIPPIDIDEFSNNSKNYAYTELIKSKVGKPVDVFDGLSVFRYSVGKNTYDIFSNDPLTKAFFMYEVRDGVFIEKKVWQEPFLGVGRCRKILLDFYLPKFDSIVSDGLHTEFGERYWKKLAAEAICRGYRLFATDGKCEIPIDDVGMMDDFYGPSNQDMQSRFIIKK